MKKLLLGFYCMFLYLYSTSILAGSFTCPNPQDLIFENGQYTYSSPYGKWITSVNYFGQLSDISFSGAVAVSSNLSTRANRIFDGVSNNLSCQYRDPRGKWFRLVASITNVQAQFNNYWRDADRSDTVSYCNPYRHIGIQECGFVKVPLFHLNNGTTGPYGVKIASVLMWFRSDLPPIATAAIPPGTKNIMRFGKSWYDKDAAGANIMVAVYAFDSNGEAGVHPPCREIFHIIRLPEKAFRIIDAGVNVGNYSCERFIKYSEKNKNGLEQIKELKF